MRNGRLTDAIHDAGGKAAIQLWQGSVAVGRINTAQLAEEILSEEKAATMGFAIWSTRLLSPA